jgi:dihydropteroate synthase
MPNRAILGSIAVGDGEAVAVIGALNVSPESFYAGSVHSTSKDFLATARLMVEAGATILDVGAMSTAPYLNTRISETEEANRLGRAVAALAGNVGVPISADTSRAVPAKAALEAGATIINDTSGLTADPSLAPLIARSGAGLIAMASERGGEEGGSPIETVLSLLEETLRIAVQAAIPESKIVVDPGIGFFRRRGIPWYEWDCAVIRELGSLRDLGRPLCVGVSRKSFIGALSRAEDPAYRLPGSLAAAAVAVVNGAQLIRAHDVVETVQAVRVAQAIARFRTVIAMENRP